jgi:hypothetical protein
VAYLIGFIAFYLLSSAETQSWAKNEVKLEERQGKEEELAAINVIKKEDLTVNQVIETNKE